MKAWDEAWATSEGRADWLVPEPFVLTLATDLYAQGVRRCLDLGCGLGRHSLALCELGMDITAIDTSPNGLLHTQETALEMGCQINLACADMGDLPFRHLSFDLIVSWNVLYHGMLHDVERAIAEIRRCLVPGGWLLCTFISVNNRHYGQGDIIEPGTYADPESYEKAHPHHYLDRQGIDELLQGFEFLYCEEADPDQVNNDHWWVLARLCDV